MCLINLLMKKVAFTSKIIGRTTSMAVKRKKLVRGKNLRRKIHNLLKVISNKYSMSLFYPC